MEFLTWHYTKGLEFYSNRYVYLLRSIVHYFSLPLLLTSLFSPWKRLVISEKKPGFDLARELENLSFNLISRGIGATVRIFLFFVGLMVLILFYVFGVVGFLVWLVVPFLSAGVYFRYKKNPEFVAGKLWYQMNDKYPVRVFFESEPGKFIASRLSVSSEKMFNISRPVKIGSQIIPKSVYEIVAFLVENGAWNEIDLRTEGVNKDDILVAARWWDKKSSEGSLARTASGFRGPGIGRELLFGYTPLLRQYSTDMGALTDFSHHLIGRIGVVSRMERVLTSGKSVILTGEPGVGKKTVVYEFARRAAKGEFGAELSYRRVLELDYNFVFSETADKNRKKQQLANVLEEASNAGNIILVLRDLHRLTSSSVEGMDLTDILEMHLERGRLKIIAISSVDDYERYLARNSRIKKFFETVKVVEPSYEEAREILLEAADDWENKKNVVITVPALARILDGCDKYITDTPFPEKALEILDSVIFFNEQANMDNIIDVNDVNQVLAEKTGISFANLNQEESAKLSNLENIIHERLVNQEEAIIQIAKILRSKSLGVISSKRPIGSFLFLGPTGVGKTETAKVLAKVYYGSVDKVIRFDMAEYVGQEGVERIIGSLSKNQPGDLTTAIKNNPASLLLLDEIEKSPPQVFNLFLAMLEEGVITDAFGKKISCNNIFVIGTSNAGAGYIRELVSKGEKNIQNKVVDFVLKNNIFSPEFVNRFDGVVVYEPLSKEHLLKIAGILLNELVFNLEKKNIFVSFAKEVLEKLAEDGYEPEFGARPMRRLIEISIGDLLGKALLSGELKPGDSITITPGNGKGEFNWQKK